VHWGALPHEYTACSRSAQAGANTVCASSHLTAPVLTAMERRYLRVATAGCCSAFTISPLNMRAETRTANKRTSQQRAVCNGGLSLATPDGRIINARIFGHPAYREERTRSEHRFALLSATATRRIIALSCGGTAAFSNRRHFGFRTHWARFSAAAFRGASAARAQRARHFARRRMARAHRRYRYCRVFALPASYTLSSEINAADSCLYASHRYHRLSRPRAAVCGTWPRQDAPRLQPRSALS